MPRPRTPILSREAIRHAAMQMVDADGLNALSMRKLADRLGVRAPSLYGHVATKDELLDDIASEVMEGVDVSGFTTGDWRAGLAIWARSYRAVLAAHPNIVPFLAYGPALRDTSLLRADAVHGGLTEAGWPPRYATMIGAATKYLVVGAAMTSFSGGFSDDMQVYLDRYPHLHQAHLLRQHADEIDNGSFELALDAFVEGLVGLYERVAGGTAPRRPA
ncbi:MAG: TetR/AcrR family transcriptional regulator [Sciscionella sp.]